MLTTGTHRHSMLNVEKWAYAFDPDKNAWLIRERGISFEQIIALIESGHLVQVLEHHDRKHYPNQLLYEVDVDGYIYVVPVVRDHHTLFCPFRLSCGFPQWVVVSLQADAARG